MSNCVVNLSTDKPAVFREAFRVLKPGGRIAISDVVLLRPLPAHLAAETLALSACIAGAASVPELETTLREAGFQGIEIAVSEQSREFISGWMPGSQAEDQVASASIRAVKPGGLPAEDKAACGPAGCCD